MIEPPFSERDWDQVRNGNKIVHVATRKWAKLDETFKFEGKTYRVKAIEKMTLSRAVEMLHHCEGYQAMMEYHDDWLKRENKRKFNGLQEVFAHYFFCVTRGE